LYCAQRLTVQPTIRSAITAGIAAAINWRHPFNGGPGDAMWGALDCSAVLRSLATEGIAILPERPPDQVKEMNRFLSDNPVVVLPSGERVQHERVPRGCTVADYPLETVLNCPHVLALANSDFLIRTAAQFLGCRPTIATLRIWWTFPGPREEESGGARYDSASFHRDRDNWQNLTFFVYLTDVDEASGPHHYVRGSHRTQLELFWPTYEPEALENAFGRDAICAVTGAAGTAFLEDGHGLHAGPTPIRQPRLILAVGYSLLPRFLSAYRPVEIEPRPAVDKYINRLYIR